MIEVKECKFVKSIYERNNFLIGIFSTKDKSVPTTARRKYSAPNVIEFTAVGYNLPSSNGISVDFEGNWEKSQYGQQLKVENHKENLPQTKKGVIAYLSSGQIKGIGIKTATAIVDKFAEETLWIIDHEPEKLLEIRGISKAKLEKMIKSIEESRELKDITAFLSPFGISHKKIAKVYKHFGNECVEVIKKEPFRLCDISGFGFRTVDVLAKKVNGKLDDKLRIRAAIECALDDAETRGHLYLPEAELNDTVHELLNANLREEAVSVKMIEEELHEACKSRRFVVHEENVYKSALWYCEKETARKIAELLTSSVETFNNIDKEIEFTQSQFNTKLSESQIEAVKMCFSNVFSIITGGPGTGKTTVLKSILDIYNRVTKDKKVLLVAPTGLAARRMADATGIAASTLHSALGLFQIDEEDEKRQKLEDLEYDFIVVDESSMLDMKLMNELIQRVKLGTRILFVGDADQLPSVGAGNVLRELLNCGVVATTHLDTVFRQNKMSRIAINAHAINNGETRLEYGTDFVFVDCNPTNIAEQIKRIYQDEISTEGFENVQILSPFKKRGKSGTINLNDEIRNVVNPKSNEQQVSGSLKAFRVGDRVIQTKNTENVCNGDIGVVKDIIEDEDDGFVLQVEFSGSRLEQYSSDDLDKLELAYAITIHKSQGSEFNTVIIPVLTEQYIMLRRNLIYTAVTRAKKKLILVGERRALFMAIGKDDVGKRNTKLGERIVESYKWYGKRR